MNAHGHSHWNTAFFTLLEEITMKKLFVFMLAAAMALTFVGTATAQDTAALTNVMPDAAMTVYWPPVYSDTNNNAAHATNTGASAYLVSNDPFLGGWTLGGTTVWGISNERTNAAGTEMRAVQLTDAGVNALTGTTPIGPPQLLTGTTSEMILFVVSDHGVANVVGQGGATLYKIDGGSGAIMSAGIPYSGYTPSTAAAAGTILSQTIGGLTTWCVAPVTLDWDEATSAASIYGVSGNTGYSIGSVAGGVSVWRRSSATLAAPTATGTTAFNFASGVSAVYAAPVVSGNSLFVVGHALGGISVFQFDKRDLTAGGNNIFGCALNSANVIEIGGMVNYQTAQITPTPTAQSEGTSGGTLYVTDWSGGVTLYDTQNLAQLFAYNYVKSTSGVSASPVASSDRLLIPWTTSVSCFATNPGRERVQGGSGVSLVWQYDFDAGLGVADGRYQIWSTPIISNGYCWVTVVDTVSAGNPVTIWRFDMNNTYQGAGEIVTTQPNMFQGPIVVGDYAANDDNENGFLWYCSYNDPTVDRVNQSQWAEAEEYWAQWKSDAAKTGENTIPERDDDEDLGDSSGCFLSTIK